MKKWIRLASVAGGLLGAVATFSSVNATEGIYFGLMADRTAIGGDFKGTSGLVSPNDVILLPEIEQGLGLGFILGMKIGPSLGFEISYLSSDRDAVWRSIPFNVEYSVLNLDILYYLKSGIPVEVYGILGMAVPDILVKRGSVGNNSQIGDVTYSGIGFNFGAGLDYYLNKNFSLGARLVYHSVDYNYAEGIATEGSIKNEIGGSGIGLMVNAIYHIGK